MNTYIYIYITIYIYIYPIYANLVIIHFMGQPTHLVMSDSLISTTAPR